MAARRRSRALGIVAAGLLGSTVASAGAWAHGTLAPNPVPSGEVRFVMSVPNGSVNVPITGFKLVAPAGVRIIEAESASGFVGSSTAVTAEWTGGSIGPPDTARFAFTAVIPEGQPRVVFQGEELYGAIPSGLFPLPVRIDESVVLQQAADAAVTDEDRTLLWIGLALIGFLVAGTVLLLAARRRRRPAEPS